jgi:hypothetical protein
MSTQSTLSLERNIAMSFKKSDWFEKIQINGCESPQKRENKDVCRFWSSPDIRFTAFATNFLVNVLVNHSLV